jgi:hypothetical protein
VLSSAQLLQLRRNIVQQRRVNGIVAAVLGGIKRGNAVVHDGADHGVDVADVGEVVDHHGRLAAVLLGDVGDGAGGPVGQTDLLVEDQVGRVVVGRDAGDGARVEDDVVQPQAGGVVGRRGHVRGVRGVVLVRRLVEEDTVDGDVAAARVVVPAGVGADVGLERAERRLGVQGVHVSERDHVVVRVQLRDGGDVVGRGIF